MTDNQPLVFSTGYRVHSYETDTHGELSITGLFNYLQDIAARHAATLHFGKEDLERENRFWVLSRIYCRMERMPRWNEELTVRTWPRGIDKLFALRDFEIFGEGGERCGVATSSWLMLSRDTRRPTRPDHLLELVRWKEKPEPAAGRDAARLRDTEGSLYLSPGYRVRYSDLDVNMHANNVKYLQWTLDAYPLEHWLKRRMASVEVNYLAESLPGDEIHIAIRELDDLTYDHSVRRNSDQRELCRIRVVWTERYK